MKKNNRNVYIVALALLLAGLGWLVFSGLNQNSVYFLNVSEALAMGTEKLDSARLFGLVDDNDLTILQDTPGAQFQLVDKENTSLSIRVDYKGAVPDTFKPGVEVIVEGGMDTSNNTFTAHTLMTKCPSKYKKEADARPM